MARRQPAQADANITAVLGASQTGKGVYCRARLREPHRGVTLVWSMMEHPRGRDRYTELLGAARVEGSIPALVAAVRSGARSIVYVPALDLPARPGRIATDDERRAYIVDQFVLWCRVVAQCREVRALVEELSRVTRASWAPDEWSNLSTAGAHAGLELIATAQRPTMIDKNFIGNCTQVRCYRLFYETDARSLAGSLQVPHREIINLPKLHYFHRTINECRTDRGVQPVK